MIRCAVLLVAFFVTACSASGRYEDYLRIRDIPPPSPEKFTHCYDYGCKSRMIVKLPQDTESKLKRLFNKNNKTPEKEKSNIELAIQIFEQDIGAMTGTKNDKRGTFRLYQDDAPETREFQQDCIDESTNTTIYLALLEQMELLQFHKPVFPTSRQPFLGGAPWWHQTAVIQNTEDGKRFAVDSWFRNNGHPAFVVPLEEWMDGWIPPKPEEEAEKGMNSN